MTNKTTLVCGAGGFIGGFLVKALIERGEDVRAVDIKPIEEWYQKGISHYDGLAKYADTIQGDLRAESLCNYVMKGVGTVANLACDMGGMGFIENNKAACMISVLINTHLLQAAKAHGVERYFYASSACVYAADKQRDPNVTALKEEDAYPAMPEDGYGWEKLFSERMCRHFMEDYGLQTRVARFHNVYGPSTCYDGGREKAPAAICRKVIAAKLSGKHEIEIWGDGNQTRSFTYITECIKGTLAIMDGDFPGPVNLGSSEMVTINQLVDIVEEIAGIKLKRVYDLTAPRGVAGRNSDNTLFRATYGWEPTTRLKDGMEKTYAWIYGQMVAKAKP